MSKQLWVIAGANGSGKSTIVAKYKSYFKNQLPVINPDDIAKEIEPNNPTHPSPATQFKSGKQAVTMQNNMLENNQSFAFETTFAGHRPVNIIKKAKELGYKTNIVYVYLENPTTHIIRVENRVLNNGHHVPTEDILRRYESSYKNLKSIYKSVDRTFVFSNAKQKHELALVLEKGRVQKYNKNVKLSKEIQEVFNVAINEYGRNNTPAR